MKSQMKVIHDCANLDKDCTNSKKGHVKLKSVSTLQMIVTMVKVSPTIFTTKSYSLKAHLEDENIEI